MSHGEGRWHPSSGEYAYLEIELLELEINGPRRHTDRLRPDR
jgi:hypothetical protein